ncbi:MAG: DUF6460 domain-containing protein [Ancalomicrobiaceae bacterium]|nr:DUF6460 domain-containing protein [Ancalomicrobiaceae bacterium]
MVGKHIERFVGGSPGRVVLRLVVLSIVIGFILAAFDLDPAALLRRIIASLSHFVEYIAHFGLGTLVQLGTYLLYGAVIVIPIWLISRLLSYRRGR